MRFTDVAYWILGAPLRPPERRRSQAPIWQFRSVEMVARRRHLWGMLLCPIGLYRRWCSTAMAAPMISTLLKAYTQAPRAWGLRLLWSIKDVRSVCRGEQLNSPFRLARAMAAIPSLRRWLCPAGSGTRRVYWPAASVPPSRAIRGLALAFAKQPLDRLRPCKACLAALS